MQKMTTKNFREKRFYGLTGNLKNKIIKDMSNNIYLSDDIKATLKSYIVRNSLEEFLTTGDEKFISIGTNSDPFLSCYNSMNSYFELIKQGKADGLFFAAIDKIIDEMYPTDESLDLTLDMFIKILEKFGFSFYDMKRKVYTNKEVYNMVMFGIAWSASTADEYDYDTVELMNMNSKDLRAFLKKQPKDDVENMLYFCPREMLDFIHNDLHKSAEKVERRTYRYRPLSDYDKAEQKNIFRRINNTKLIHGFRKNRTSRDSINYIYASDIDCYLFTLDIKPTSSSGKYMRVIAIPASEAQKNILEKLLSDIEIIAEECIIENNLKDTLYKDLTFEQHKKAMETIGFPCPFATEEEWLKSLIEYEISLPLSA